MSIAVNNYFNTAPTAYQQNSQGKLCETDNEGTDRFDRVLVEMKSANLPSFIGKVYTREELMQSVDEQVQRNQSKKIPLEQLLLDLRQGVNAKYSFAGEDKKYSYYDFVEEFKKRSGKVEGYFEEKGLASEKVVTDEELAAIAKENDTEKIAAKEYDVYKSENYKIVPDKEAKCFDIYNSQGERLGVFDYADIKIRRDSATGKQFLISEHGTMSYDALVLDNELKSDLQKIMGVDALETEELRGYTLKKHSGTGIRYLVRDGEEGRGGKVLLENAADQKKYEALAETYLNCYPNLIESKEEAYIWADLEIKGLAQHTKDGIISMGFDGMSYNDNVNSKNNWSVLFSEGTYQAVFEWLQNNKEGIKEMQKFATWQDVFESIGSRYERIWSKDEEKQGYLNN